MYKYMYLCIQVLCVYRVDCTDFNASIHSESPIPRSPVVSIKPAVANAPTPRTCELINDATQATTITST